MDPKKITRLSEGDPKNERASSGLPLTREFHLLSLTSPKTRRARVEELVGAPNLIRHHIWCCCWTVTLFTSTTVRAVSEHRSFREAVTEAVEGFVSADDGRVVQSLRRLRGTREGVFRIDCCAMLSWWGRREDPCLKAMKDYLRCVEGKQDGLREGDECIDEANVYKECRKRVKQAERGDANKGTTDEKKQPR